MHQALPKSFERVVFALLEDLNTPRSLTVKLLIEHGEWDQLLRLKVDSAQYCTSWDYFRDVQATELLRKCGDLPGTSEKIRHINSVQTFHTAEMQCAKTNVRFLAHLSNYYSDLNDRESIVEMRIRDILESVKKQVTDILGNLPKTIEGRHGPGATFSDRSRRTTIPDKHSTRPTITSDARCLLPFWEDTSWCRELMKDMPYQSDPVAVRGNRFTSVPKDALKNRGICIEPSINIFLQLGLGGVIRRRLQAHGIELESAQFLHRQVAREASRNGHMCTIDLSNASDTVSHNLVKFLLPESWYETLKSLRSPFSVVEGRITRLEKFSSMGNGFTFELETLIFLSLAMVACRLCDITPEPGKNVHVYGDDIIVPVQASSCLLALLRYCGFTPNSDKTFTNGVFRESCGGDYFLGDAVRPHYIEGVPCEATAWISLANGLRRVATEYFSSGAFLGPFQRAWFRALDSLPSRIRRLRGPVSFGDAVIHDEREFWVTRTRHSIHYIRAYVAVGKPIPLNRWGAGAQLASALYGVPSTGPIPRKGGKDLVSGYREKWLARS